MRIMKRNLKHLPIVITALLLLAPLHVWATGMSAQALVAEAMAGIKTIPVSEAYAMYGKSGVLFVDVREDKEYKSGHIPGSVNIPRGVLELEIERTAPDRAATIVVYCRSGARSALAAATLVKMGYTNVLNMDGGWNSWLNAGYPVE